MEEMELLIIEPNDMELTHMAQGMKLLPRRRQQMTQVSPHEHEPHTMLLSPMRSPSNEDSSTTQNMFTSNCLENMIANTSSSIGKEVDSEPRVGMIFENLDVAWKFWQKYGKLVGFGVRIQYRNKSKMDKVPINALFVCRKEGKRKEDKRRVGSVQRWEERTQCKVRLNVVLDRSIGKYTVKEFFAEHNHELEPLETSHMLRSHRQMSEAQAASLDLARDSGISPKAIHQLRIREARGVNKLGYIMEDQKTYLRSKREKSMIYGDLGSIIRYFDKRKMKDPSFFYSMQFDSDELVTNIFWADSRMIVDYGDFGYVITSDTTYGTNKALRPLGVFTSFNHHKQMVIFGGTLLYDETVDSFVWLFETLLKAHGGKEPQTRFTDQDAAMANALARVLTNMRHGLCTWHLNQENDGLCLSLSDISQTLH